MARASGTEHHSNEHAKVEYFSALVDRQGFKHIDAVSFVSPKAVSQMADSEEVMKLFLASLPPCFRLLKSSASL